MEKVINIDNLKSAIGLSDEVIEFLKTLTVDTPNQKYTFGEDCFVKVISCDLKKEAFNEKNEVVMEAHEEYIDIQYLVNGEEKILYTDKEGLSVEKPYNAEKDVIFYGAKEYEEVCYQAGEAVILPVVDAHLPGCAVNELKTVKKAVIKLKNK